MAKVNKSISHKMENDLAYKKTVIIESSSEQENDQEVTFNTPQVLPSMFMPYIRVPKWTRL